MPMFREPARFSSVMNRTFTSSSDSASALMSSGQGPTTSTTSSGPIGLLAEPIQQSRDVMARPGSRC